MTDTLKDKIKDIEREAILKALEECEWIQARAARKLGITERMIGYKIKKYGIKIREVKMKRIFGLIILALMLFSATAFGEEAALAAPDASIGLTASNIWMMVATFLVFIMHLGFASLEALKTP
jgi:Nif-specific regulatory protein